ncbi:hypothetical protein [Benzoatithermus flavus]|uniref:Right handed beta helix region n=1 Tax=Benzoatithermus flavus TaxID=3108223 RepID=A0ABU8XWC6_9PROT
MELRAAAFGLRSDAIADQSTALLRLRNAMTADRTRHYRVVFEPGDYRYTNNRWLFGVVSVTIEANGASFGCLSPSDAEQNARPLNVNSIFQDHGDRPWPDGLTYHTGWPAARSLPAGSGIVPLQRPDDSRRCRVGAPVLVHSFDQQFGGFPPNLRRFEWRRVAAVDRVAGTVALDAPLAFDHDAGLRDTVYDDGSGLAFGRARLMLLDRPAYRYPERIEILDARFVRNPSQPQEAANGLCLAADTLILRRCSHDGMVWPSENRVALYEDCRFTDVEVDKLCGEVTFRGCSFARPVTGATGVMNLLLERCRIEGFVGVSPRRARIVGCAIHTSADDPWGAIRCHYDTFPVEMLECIDNEIVTGGPLHFAINGGRSHTLTVSASGEGNEILLDDTRANREGVISQLAEGALLRLETGTATGTLARIGWTGRQWLLCGDWPVRVAPGQVWSFSNVQAVRERGTRLIGAEAPVLRTPPVTQRLL